ncbi:unnamed protein product [Bemisia tabaci]|uniref:Uncharacterized protein n=1 Tax=Bemisia tabaci TaxID=7038 RepID=A0A9P0CDD7_BEMTA|nr:unnamed protein product [Bemisia tabaci]
MPDGCPLTSDINNNNRSGSGHGNCSRCASNACGNTKCNSGACYGQTPGAAHQNGGGSAYAGAASQGGGVGGRNNACGGAGSGMGSSGKRVQVTAKILFGSVSAISNMKHSEKLHRKRSQ